MSAPDAMAFPGLDYTEGYGTVRRNIHPDGSVDWEQHSRGMTTMEYATIHFTAAWIMALGQRGGFAPNEANDRALALGKAQAETMFPGTQET